MSKDHERPAAAPAGATSSGGGPPDASSAPAATGMRQGLTSYGDTGFSLFLRKAFIKGAARP